MKSRIIISFFCIISLRIVAQTFPCSSATALTNIINYCSNNAQYTNAPPLTGTTTVAACWTGNPTQDVWFSFTATQTDVLISVNGAGSGGGTIINPCIALYIGPCAANLTEITCVNGTSNITQLYKGGLAPGTVYLIRISTTAANKGTFKLCVNNYTPTLNPGADCAGAAYICNKNSISVPKLSGGGSNTHEPEITSCGGGVAESNSCWYTFTCQTSGTLTFDLIPTDVNNDIDFIFYKLNGTNVCTGRTIMRCNFHGCGTNNGPTGLNTTSTDSSVAAGTCATPPKTYCKQVNLVAGTSYALFINDFNGNSGFSINWGGTSTFLGPVPKITASDTTICAGQSVIFNGSTSTNWTSLSWNFSSGGNPVSATGVGPHTVTYNTAGSYVAILEGVSAGGCKTVKSINIIVSDIPTVTIAPPGTLTCGAGSISLSATANPLPVTYTWSGPGIVSGGTTANPTVNAAGNYMVTVTNPTGCTATASVTVTSSSSSITTATGTNVSCNGGADGTATASTTGGTAPYSYSWNSVPAQTTVTATGLSAGTYIVIVTDAMGCISNASVTITEPPAIILTTSEIDANCGGADGSASVSASGGTSPYTYSWNCAPLQTTQTANGLIANSYMVIVTDSKGCTNTTVVNVGDIGSPILTTSKVDVLCNGTATGSITTTVTAGAPPYTYTWSNSAITPDINNLPAGNYTLTVSGTNNCKVVTTITIAEPAAIVLTTSETDANCGASDGSASVSVSGGVTPYSYSWNTSPVQITANANNIPSGGYSVTVTDFNGCIETAAVNINNIGASVLSTSFTDVNCNGGNDGTATVSATGGVAPYTYSWNSIPAQTTATATGLKAGSYIITVTAANGCKTIATIIISEPSAIVLSTTTTPENCGKRNGTATVSASGGTAPYTYLWSTSPVQTTATATGLDANTYIAIVYDIKNCSQSTSATIINVPGPAADFIFMSACANAPVIFSNTSSSNTISWIWDFGDGNISTLKDPSNSYITAGIYPVKLIVTDAGGCKDSIIKNVIVYPSPIVIFGDTTMGCSPLSVTFTNNSTGAGSVYLWDFGDNSTSKLQTPSHTYTNGTQTLKSYTVSLTVTSVNGCTSSGTKNNLVSVYPLPSAVFTMNPGVTDIMTPTVNFYNHSVGNFSNRWNFGDGDTSSLSNPVHTYKDTGVYHVCLSIVNSYGCPDDICSTVIIKPTWSFFIPNSFTPNGDLVNDGFRGYGENIKEYQLLIFDRWGNQIFKTTDLSEAWNGKANNGAKIAQQDVYVYVVILKDVFSANHRYTGTVTLVK